MPTFNLISVKYGKEGVFDSWIENGQADAWFKNMAGSEQYFGWLSEYNLPTQSIQPGTYGGNYSITANVSQSATVTQDQAVATLIAAIETGELPKPDATTQYIIHFPKDIFVPDFCQVFCAYHYFFNYNELQVKYSVLPYGSDCQGCAQSYELFGVIVSHEVAETVTDPLGFGYGDLCYGEIGDICVNAPAALAKGSDGNE